jgi:hypothetical protein
MRDQGLWSSAMKGVRIQGRHKTLHLALAAVWTVKTHAMAHGDQEEGRSWRRQQRCRACASAEAQHCV